MTRELPVQVLKRHCEAKGVHPGDVLACLLGELQSGHIMNVGAGRTLPGHQPRVSSEIASRAQYDKSPEPVSLLHAIEMLLRRQQPLHVHNAANCEKLGRPSKEIEWLMGKAKCEEALILTIRDLINQGEHMSVASYLERDRREKESREGE